MNKSEIKYETPLKLQSLENGKYINKNKYYKCVGEFHQSNGGILYVVEDNSKFVNFYNKDRFALIGNWEERIVDSESVSVVD